MSGLPNAPVQTLLDNSSRYSQFSPGIHLAPMSPNAKHLGDSRQGEIPVLPENTYRLIFLNFFRCDVNLISSLIVAADEDPES
jgi:hypothetical protein